MWRTSLEGGEFIVAALAAQPSRGAATDRAVLVVVLVIIWGLRLALHIGMRNRGKREDAHYRKWREAWGKHAVLRSRQSYNSNKNRLISQAPKMGTLPLGCISNETVMLKMGCTFGGTLADAWFAEGQWAPTLLSTYDLLLPIRDSPCRLEQVMMFRYTGE